MWHERSDFRKKWQPVGGANSPEITTASGWLTSVNAPIESIEESPALANLAESSGDCNPGALAGATEAKVEKFWEWFDSNVKRQAGASRIIEAVLSCDPEDRVLFLETILDQIRPGWPKSFNIDVMEEAGWWADTATTPERKAYMLACYRRLSRTDKEAFLTYITGRAAA